MEAESGPRTQVLIPTEPTKRGQGYGLMRFYEARFPRFRSTPERMRLRVDIDRNAYDHQSHYRVDVWTSGSGWVRVVELLPESDAVTSLPSYTAWQRRQADCVAAVERVAQQLVDDAVRILA
jgi:hypothetical protein